jgi:hypothetical protein
MKTMMKFKFVSAVFAVGILFSSCAKEPVDPITALLELPGSTLKDGDVPNNIGGANAPIINTLNANVNFIAGGGCPIQVFSTAQGSNTISKVFLGADGYDKYYEMTVLSSLFSINPIVMQSVTRNSITLKVSVGDNAGNVSSVHTATLSRVDAGTGVLQISLTFDKDTDLDLYLVEPNGEVIYYGNSTSANGGLLDLDSNPGCWIDGVNNENITYDSQATIESGTYTVRVNNYSDCVGQQVNYILTARYNGSLIPVSGNTNPYNGSFAAGTATGGGQSAGTVIYTFNIMDTQPGTRSLPASVASYK